MSFTILLPIITAIILLRIFWLHLRSSNAHNENFKQLTPKDKLSVLKECLLNDPVERNLQNLKKFAIDNGISLDADTYKPLMQRQLAIKGTPNALEEDNKLFAEEAEWMDKITPLEFAEANAAKENSDTKTYLLRSLEGISRLYSDEAILNELKKIEPLYPKAATLYEGYQTLMNLRDNSLADNDSLEKLRRAKDSWESDLLNLD